MADEQDRPVGYKRPPVATQFKPGISGNPSGRPKSVKSFGAELLDELGEIVCAREGDSEVQISKARAIVKSLVNAALGGNLRASALLLPILERIGGASNELQGEPSAPEDAEILENYLDREFRRRIDGCDADNDGSQIDVQQSKEEEP